MNIIFEKRRKFNRISYNEPANLDFSNGNYYGNLYDECRINNLSLTGMLILGNFQANENDLCNVIFHYKTSHGHIRIKILCKTIWCSEEGIGLMFISMTNETYMLLKTILIHNSERPATILHEFPEAPPFNTTLSKDDGYTKFI